MTAHNAFNWQLDKRDSIVARDYINCTTAYNQWRALPHDARPQWEVWRDKKMDAVRVDYATTGTRARPAKAFGAVSGAVPGLSRAGDKWIENYLQNEKQKATAAYSKAVPAHIPRPTTKVRKESA